MPTYGYQCRACGHEFEVIQKITDAALTACEKCGGAVKKLLYPVGIQFKGAGFYITDYVRSSQAGKDGGAETKPSETAKTDTKATAGSTE